MNWIKKNPHLLTLCILALGLAAASAMVIVNSQSFDQKFSSVMTPVAPSDKMASLDIKKIEDAENKALKPELWIEPPSKNPNSPSRPLFVPVGYSIDSATNMPKKVIETSYYHDTLTGASIPNKWFQDHGLSVGDPKIQFSDTDNDGFLAEDEWRGSGATPGANSTDPNNKDSHPPYWTKLFLKKYIRNPFLLKFQSYDGDPKAPEKMEFQINTLSLRQPTLFLKMGDVVPKTVYKIEKFEFKEIKNDKTGENQDVSELTLLNTESNDRVVLVLTQIKDSPDSYAQLIYEWPKVGQPFVVKRLGTFVLAPDGKDKPYKLLDIKENAAEIQTPTGEKVTISKDPRQP